MSPMNAKRPVEGSAESRIECTQTRRSFLEGATMAVAISATLGTESSHRSKCSDSGPVSFGDIHTHTALSDGNGSPEDNFELASSHLDFWSLTDHAFDEVVFSLKYGGEERLNRHWHQVQELCRSHEAAGSFVPFLGYEWTNFGYGHHNVYYLC